MTSNAIHDDSGPAKARGILAAYDSGEIDISEAEAQLRALTSEETRAAEAALGLSWLQKAPRHTRRAWYEGIGEGDEPPVPWGELPDDVVAKIATRVGYVTPAVRGARKEMARRLPEGWAFVAGEHAVFADGSTALVYEPRPQGLVAAEPDPGGWLARGAKGRSSARLVGGSVYAAIERLRKAKRGTLDVRRAIGLYGRHETKRFPRFLVMAFRTPLVVGVDDALGARLDDLAAVAAVDPALVPEDAWWLPASVRVTGGGLHIAARPSGVATALVVVEGWTMGKGRHGRAGSDVYPASNNRAPVTHRVGVSNGGGRSGSALIAAVAEGLPLLLADGSGYEMRAGRVYRVPGIATGSPGEAKEV